ncbi:MAG: coproporphyrinogen-III oxidase family protein, partial [candidate division WOR-3 bacterium]|nr:coproporphyrinogen-III oxidase family protein [candidate division WOR-3 bacterium]
MHGIYIHIPFCRSKCRYCSFVSYPGPDSRFIAAYFNALKEEINTRSKLSESVDSVYIGGGTPSLVNSDYIADILHMLNNEYDIKNSAEITIEMNPESVTSRKIESYMESGINRLSVGIQSMDNNVLKLLGRPHSRKEAEEALAIIESYSINTSIDLLWGIKGHLFECSVLDNHPSVTHVSAYMLTPESGSYFFDNDTDIEEDESGIISEYSSLLDELGNRGFERYEVSNYARDNMYARHNTLYWDIHNTYTGYGPSACSYNLSSRRTNTRDIALYTESPLVCTVESISDSKRQFEEIMLGMRT